MKLKGKSVELITASIAWLEITKGGKAKKGEVKKWKDRMKRKPVEII